LNIPDFLTAAAELEMAAAMIYETMADLSPEVGIARHLRALANDETRHADAITMGKRYQQEMSDAFGRTKMEDKEILKGIEDGNAFRASLTPGYALTDGLKKMLKFERRFEKIHIAASIEITNPLLKRLFETLTKSDKSHIVTLNKLLESRLNAG
jgi:rubrerythrin